MKVADFDYFLPKNLIANSPANPRDHSWLLVLNKQSGAIEHKKFFNIIDYLKSGDVLVLNDSKVIPARLLGKKITGGEVEIFLCTKNKELSKSENDVWQCLAKGGRLKETTEIFFANNFKAKLLNKNLDNTWTVEFNLAGENFFKKINKIGQVPLPPYINSESKNDKEKYQTVFASEGKKGSVAAPTAGLHFTKSLLKKIKDKGIIIEYVTLHVGLGTFLPVKVDDIEDHKMHAEWVEIKKETIEKIIEAKNKKHKIYTVGTTSTRSLEACFSKLKIKNNKVADFNEWVDIFIYPSYEFKIVDGMITNFHLPKSTLIMLVSALAGSHNIKIAYKEAIKLNYRFYSYGDAMFIK